MLDILTKVVCSELARAPHPPSVGRRLEREETKSCKNASKNPVI